MFKIAEEMVKRLFILRGIPGSGKSTISRRLAEKHPGIVISERDKFYINPENGKYEWAPEKVPIARQKQLLEIEEALKSGKSAIADSLHLMHSQYDPLLDIAERTGARPIIIDVPFNKATPELYASRNLHGVPLNQIENMIKSWQPGRSKKFLKMIGKIK